MNLEKQYFSVIAIAFITFSLITVNSAQASTSSEEDNKFFLALFLQYADDEDQVAIYSPHMQDEDQTRLRVQDQATLKADYIDAAKSLPGEAGVSFKSSKAIIQNAKKVKDLGFDFIEFNLESGLSPSTDSNNVVSAMKKAADATHNQGLEFRATPSKAFLTKFGSQIAPFVDYFHIQAQSLQDNGIDDYSDYVHTQTSKLRNANSALLISAQVSTQQDSAPGMTLQDTLRNCTDSVMDTVDGVSVWFGNGDLAELQSFVEWYDDRFS